MSTPSRPRPPAKRRSSSPAAPSARQFRRQRKLEVMGFLTMAIALLLALAVVTHNPADNLRLEEEGVWDRGDNRMENLLGPIGATISRALVTGLFGYPMLVPIGLVFAWGYALFRQRTPVMLPTLTGLLLAGTLFAACFFGWFAVGSEAEGALTLWSGQLGFGVAAWLSGLAGRVGAFIILSAALVVVALLLIDRDIQASLDRAEGAVARLRDSTTAAFAAYRAAAAERRALRDQALLARRQEQARTRAESQKARAAAAREARRTAPPEPPSGDAYPPSGDAYPPSGDAYPHAAAPGAPPASDALAADGPPSFRDTADPWAALPEDAFVPQSDRGAPPPDGAGGHAASDDDVDAGLVGDLVGEALAAGPALHIHPPPETEPVDLDAAAPPETPASRRPDERAIPYAYPSIELLEEADGQQRVDPREIEDNKQILLDKLETYNIEISAIHAVVGPTVTRYELTPAPGIKISRITALEDDLAMALAAPGIRIIAPIPGKSAIGVEIPNRSREMVRLRQMLATAAFRDAGRGGGMALPVPIGKTIEGEVFLEDLARMPHLLIAGATGSGKSVGLNALVTGLLYAKHPADLKFVMVDPKKIELNGYAALLNHFMAMPADAEDPITTDFAQAAAVLRSCEREMELRYDLLAEAGVRGIVEYNRKVATGALASFGPRHRHLPYVVVVIDELADLMMTSAKEVEAPIARLAQMARAVGIHLVIATQRPSVDVITGLIKANFPSRMAYQVASRIDSRTIIDGGGAQHLIGNGDLLYMNGSRLTRLQGPFLSVDEVEAVAGFIGAQEGAGPYLLPPMEPGESLPPGAAGAADAEDRDELFEEAARVIVRSQQGSVSLLQRKLSVGYTRAARLVDQLEEAGVVGPFEGSKARDVLITSEAQLDALLHGAGADEDL
ncbi:MAG: DNA translocase FtsK 4TM domain-containing protein [Rubricoccaceae bacterium]